MNFNSLSLEKKSQRVSECYIIFRHEEHVAKALPAKDQRYGMYIMQLVFALSLSLSLILLWKKDAKTGPFKGEWPACTCKFGTSTRPESINHALHVVVFVVGIAGRAGSILSNSVHPSRARTAHFDKGSGFIPTISSPLANISLVLGPLLLFPSSHFAAHFESFSSRALYESYLPKIDLRYLRENYSVVK